MSVRENLIAARALIDTPEKWRQDSEAREPSCCAVVAVNRVFGTTGGWTDAAGAQEVRSALYQQLPDYWKKRPVRFRNVAEVVGDYNDDGGTTHADILALFDRAITSQSLPSKGEV